MSLLKGICLLAVLGVMPAFAQAPVATPTLFNLDFRADVQSDGVPSNIVPDPLLAPALQALLRKRVSEWRYKIDMWQGKPVHGPVSQRIVAEAVPVSSGGFALRIKSAGPRTVILGPESEIDGEVSVPPVYPPELQRRGVGGVLVYALKVDAQGKPEEVELIDPVNLDRTSKLLDASARVAIAQWTMRPVKVDGVPADCRFLLPITFEVSGVPLRVGPDYAAYRAAYSDVCPSPPTLLTKVVGSLL